MRTDYATFKGNWVGRRIDYDHIFGFQCVDLIKQWAYENGVTGIYGNAIDYANSPSPEFRENFSRVAQASAQRGDVVVLHGKPNNPYGHIGLFDGANLNGVALLEQNMMGGGNGEGRNAIGVYRTIPNERVAGVFRLNGEVPTPPPAPARQTVTLPGHVQSWRLYRVGSYLRPNTADQIAVLAPARFGGLTYKVEAWVGDYAVVIQTQMFGRGVVWVKNTEAVIS